MTKRFRAQDSHKKARVNPRWRKPRGLHSKIRLAKKGYCIKVKVGYGSPKKTIGTHKGKALVRVSTVKEIEGLDQEIIIIIQASTGQKKRLAIVKKAIEMKIGIQGMKKPETYVAEIEQKLQEKQQQKERRAKEKEKKKKEKEAKAKEKEDKEKKDDTELDEKVTKEEEKKEQDRMLARGM
ncbi:MAG: eL32 family ribosomal protein [Nanoarchaeota archaeon]|nr:eL32 family ribosomal protein [Nanoarchaeota archaeon]